MTYVASTWTTISVNRIKSNYVADYRHPDGTEARSLEANIALIQTNEHGDRRTVLGVIDPNTCDVVPAKERAGFDGLVTHEQAEMRNYIWAPPPPPKPKPEPEPKPDPRPQPWSLLSLNPRELPSGEKVMLHGWADEYWYFTADGERVFVNEYWYINTAGERVHVNHAKGDEPDSPNIDATTS